MRSDYPSNIQGVFQSNCLLNSWLLQDIANTLFRLRRSSDFRTSGTLRVCSFLKEYNVYIIIKLIYRIMLLKLIICSEIFSISPIKHFLIYTSIVYLNWFSMIEKPSTCLTCSENTYNLSVVPGTPINLFFCMLIMFVFTSYAPFCCPCI